MPQRVENILEYDEIYIFEGHGLMAWPGSSQRFKLSRKQHISFLAIEGKSSYLPCTWDTLIGARDGKPDFAMLQSGLSDLSIHKTYTEHWITNREWTRVKKIPAIPQGSDLVDGDGDYEFCSRAHIIRETKRFHRRLEKYTKGGILRDSREKQIVQMLGDKQWLKEEEEENRGMERDPKYVKIGDKTVSTRNAPANMFRWRKSEISGPFSDSVIMYMLYLPSSYETTYYKLSDLIKAINVKRKRKVLYLWLPCRDYTDPIISSKPKIWKWNERNPIPKPKPKPKRLRKQSDWARRHESHAASLRDIARMHMETATVGEG